MTEIRNDRVKDTCSPLPPVFEPATPALSELKEVRFGDWPEGKPFWFRIKGELVPYKKTAPQNQDKFERELPVTNIEATGGPRKGWRGFMPADAAIFVSK